MYCVYLTTYFGNKLPMFYIGSSSTSRILKGYKGSVSSKKYKDIWKFEIKNNPSMFKTRVLCEFITRKEALVKERELQQKLNVIKSPLYTNLSIAQPDGFCGMDVRGKDHPAFGLRRSEESKQKQSKAMLGKTHSVEAKQKISKAATGKNNPMFGRTHNSEVRCKLANNAKERFSGKSYEVMYGETKAQDLKNKRSLDRKQFLKDNPTTGSKNPNAKVFIIIDPSGTTHTVAGNLKTFCIEHKICRGQIADMAKGFRTTPYKGWICSYQ